MTTTATNNSKLQRGVVLDVLGFVASLTLTYFFGWSTKDLVWSLWISSLTIGYLYLLLGFAEPVARKGFGPGDRILRAVGGLIGLAFFTLHFGGAHYVYGSKGILNS
ncbi:MAG: DUF6498-containing protein [Bacteroidota bacterium]